MFVRVKKLHPDAVIPKYAKDGDAGLDLAAVSRKIEGDLVCYDTGLAFEIPKGYVGLVFPRSSIAKTKLNLSNSVAVIDSGYRGSIQFKFRTIGDRPNYDVGDRIGQIIIIPYPNIELYEVDELSSTDRGDGGFGSTNKEGELK